jgi:hypothetical protein
MKENVKTEYQTASNHTNIESSQNQAGNDMQQISSGNGVTVTIIFPEKSDQKSEQEFVQRLKLIYLDKLMKTALQCPPMENPRENK